MQLSAHGAHLPCNCTQVVDQVCLGHSNTRVNQGQGSVGLVWDDVHKELWLSIEQALVSQGLEADLVNGITGVGDQLTKEDCGATKTILSIEQHIV